MAAPEPPPSASEPGPRRAVEEPPEAGLVDRLDDQAGRPRLVLEQVEDSAVRWESVDRDDGTHANRMGSIPGPEDDHGRDRERLPGAGVRGGGGLAQLHLERALDRGLATKERAHRTLLADHAGDRPGPVLPSLASMPSTPNVGPTGLARYSAIRLASPFTGSAGRALRQLPSPEAHKERAW